MTPLNQAATSHEPAARAHTIEATQDMVVSVIAEVTRYPRDILLPDAHLEEELGIDSVKRAEILAVLASRFNIPESGGPPPTEIRTIGDLVGALDQFLAGRDDAPVRAEAPPPPPAAAVDLAPRLAASNPAPASDPLARRVVDVIAQVTRYPRELLVPTADLEDDLGFDHGQRSSIYAALGRELAPAFPAEGPTPSARTIGDVIAAVERLGNGSQPSARPAAPAPVAAPAVLTQIHPPGPAAKPFAGRVALVTGSGHGLGRTFAMRLASLGATVVINSFHSRQRGEETTQQINEEGGEAIHLWGSVANAAHLESIYGEIGKRYGGLDFFISNATNGVLAPLTEIKPEDWDQAFRTNVVALHQGSLMASELMQKRGGGKIVAISTPGSQRYVDHYGCMGPTKAAVECLVRYLAIELGEHNIQVNALTVGPIYGDRLSKYPDGDSLRPRWQANVPRRRFNDEDEVTDAVVFLLTNSGMNGTVLLLDAGGTQRIVAGSS